MRVSDQDRSRAIEELRRHHAAGRLDLDDYARRVELAATAATLEELDRALSDLPMMRIADPSKGGIWARSEPGRGLVASGSGSTPARLAVSAALTTVVVVVAVVVALTVGWGVAVTLVAGWLAGVLQGRLGGYGKGGGGAQ